MNLSPENIKQLSEVAIENAVTRAPKIIWAIFTLLIWLWIIKMLGKVAKKWFKKTKIDTTVAKFLTSMITVGLKILLLIAVAGQFGVETTSFIAIIWAAGLAIGLALQGSLANFAGGVLILLFKPYKVGDLIETQGIFGKVEEISIFVTKIFTPENKTAIVPNGPIANGNIINYTTQGNIRVDVNVGVAYNEDIDNAKKVLMEVITNNPDVIQSHGGNGVFVNELADSSVNFIVRWFTQPEKYRDVYFWLTEGSKKALDKAGIDIPFPHRVIHTVGN